MRALLWLLTLAALAVGLALAARYNDGYVLLVLAPWRVELSLNLLILLQVFGFFLLYLLLRAVSHMLSLPQAVREFRARRSREKAEQAFGNAVRFIFEGRYGHTLKNAAAAYAAGHLPGLSALLAARAAHAMRDEQREREWLARALEHEQKDGSIRLARLMTEAELLIGDRNFDAAQEVLDALAVSGRHIAAQRLALRACQALGDWREAVRIVRQLEKHRALTQEQAAPLKLHANREILRAVSSDMGSLVNYWRGLPADERHQPRLAEDVARSLIALGDSHAAQRILEEELDAGWDSRLVAVYAECRQGDVLERIAKAESWLRQQPYDAQLLLALGRLCRQQQLWGKAQSFLEASLSVQESRAVHIELAQLFDVLERHDDANRHYRAAALSN